MGYAKQTLKQMALSIAPIRKLWEDRSRLAQELERATNGAGSKFWNYQSTFDAIEIMRRNELPSPEASPLHLTNFLGVKIDPRFFPGLLDGRAGEVEPIPIPANWHADISEWAAALRAVELAARTFTVLELGCGWGCWMNNTGVAARRRGLRPMLIGIEGDSGHIEFAKQAAFDNGFEEGEIELHHGIAAARDGTALFPRQLSAGVSWGLEPIFDATQEDMSKLSVSHEALPMVSLDRIVERHPRIDLLHIDIQGGEADLIEQCLKIMGSHVAYVLVGTHSRQIEGRVFSALLSEGWTLEIERPAIIDLATGAPVVMVDGVQGWRNQRLLPSS